MSMDLTFIPKWIFLGGVNHSDIPARIAAEKEILTQKTAQDT